MAALSGEKALAELSAGFGVYPRTISGWKQELVKRAGELYAPGNKRRRSSCRPQPERAEESDLLKRLDQIFTEHPLYGSRRLQVTLLREGISIGRRHLGRLRKKLELSAVRPKRNTSKRHPEHRVYPYLLRGKTIDQPNDVWAADIIRTLNHFRSLPHHLRIRCEQIAARSNFRVTGATE